MSTRATREASSASNGQSDATFAERARVALASDFLRRAVRFTADRLRNAKQSGTEALGNWEEWRERGAAIRAHTIENLDHYLAEFAKNVEARGGRIHFASDSVEARATILDIARGAGANLAVKSKSMVTEELHLNDHLAGAGIESLETDLGEWIVQLAGEMPSHIILPAIHKSRKDIQALFAEHGGARIGDETRVLAGYARAKLREKFLAADVGITGCNFAVAESGSVAIFTNEGNGRMVTTLPRVHVVVMGMERIVPTFADLEMMANLLPRSATGQKITTYLNIVTGPRREDEVDGPDELHVVVLDNGRSRQLGDPEFQSILNCIRCGACLNVCPVYRQVGGHAYGSVYPGPIGAVLTPLLEPEKESKTELANASSLCGACTEACPVKIPLHDMLLHLRARNVEHERPSWSERWSMMLAAQVLRSPRTFAWSGRLARLLQRWTIQDGTRMRALQKLAPPVAAWTKHRNLPEPPRRSFREMWPEIERDLETGVELEVMGDVERDVEPEVEQRTTRGIEPGSARGMTHESKPDPKERA
jgi:L-lactate dehydrogenase complex protein LldF